MTFKLHMTYPSKSFHFAAVAFFLFLVLCSCSGNSFTLDFDLSSETDANYRLVYYEYGKQGGAFRESTAALVQGKAHVVFNSTRPTVVWLFDAHNIPTIIYARKGEKIKITGSTTNPASWQIGGNDTNKQLSEWRNANESALTSNIPDSVNAAVARYILQSPDSEIAPLLLLTSYNRSEGETEFRRLFYKIAEYGHSADWEPLVARNDLPGGYPRTPAKLGNMIVRSLQNGIDTIDPSRKRATILYFWHTGENGRSLAIDTLKTLVKEFPDSASRIIADIGLEHDSIAWMSPLAKDSLEKVARLWMPHGLADTRLIEMQVTRTPFWIVLSPDGNQFYRGTDAGKAANAFRTVEKESTKAEKEKGKKEKEEKDKPDKGGSKHGKTIGKESKI